MRRTRAEIDLNALESNINLIRDLLGKKIELSAVVKGNAYGHGIVGISKKLEKLDIASLCVAYTDEGIVLREAGIKTPIILIAPFWEKNLKDILAFDLTPTIYDFKSLNELNSYAQKENRSINIHLKIDSGMNRLGFKPENSDKLLESLSKAKAINIIGISSHFCDSDNPNQKLTKEQLKLFSKCASYISKSLKTDSIKHIANSAAVASSENYYLDMVRPGLSLYGYTMSKNKKINGSLKKVLSLKSWISMTKTVKEGEFVGYNKMFLADKEYKIGIIPIGYADGYLKRYKELGYVLIKGRKSKILGSICMDMIFCDLSNISEAKQGDEVTLIGEDGRYEINALDYAKACDTIPYEILTSISDRVPRIFIDRNEL